MSLINHYSILWGVAFLFAIFLYSFRKDDAKKKKLYVFTGITVALLSVWFTTRAQTGSTESASVLREQIGQGQPVLVELQSPFWAACAAAQPIVDGIEEEFAGELVVLQINIQADTGKDFAREFGSFTPTFVFIDAEGNELWRSLGTLDAEQVRASMQK